MGTTDAILDDLAAVHANGRRMVALRLNAKRDLRSPLPLAFHSNNARGEQH